MTTLTQDPNGLFDMLKTRFRLKNDAALARYLLIHPPQLSKMRKFMLPVGDAFVLRCVEFAGVPLAEVRAFVPSPYTGAA